MVDTSLVLRIMSLDLTDYKWTLLQVMAWCCQATNHYLSQCWPRSLSPYDITCPQWDETPKSLHLKMPSPKWQPFCLNVSSLNVLTHCDLVIPSHYLNQCWFIMVSSSDNHLRAISHKETLAIKFKLAWKLLTWKLMQICQGPMS